MSFSLTNILGICIEVKVEGQQVFRLQVNKDGHVNKFSLVEGQGHMDIFEDHGEYFKRILRVVVPTLLERNSGRFDFPERRGKECDLIVVFQGADDRVKSFEFIYGMESKCPPKDIMDLVIEAFKHD